MYVCMQCMHKFIAAIFQEVIIFIYLNFPYRCRATLVLQSDVFKRLCKRVYKTLRLLIRQRCLHVGNFRQSKQRGCVLGIFKFLFKKLYAPRNTFSFYAILLIQMPLQLKACRWHFPGCLSSFMTTFTSTR